MSGWNVYDMRSGVHVAPHRDAIAHDLHGLDCPCGPDVEWTDPDDGETYVNGPFIKHHSLDGREAREYSA